MVEYNLEYDLEIKIFRILLMENDSFDGFFSLMLRKWKFCSFYVDKRNRKSVLTRMILLNCNPDYSQQKPL